MALRAPGGERSRPRARRRPAFLALAAERGEGVGYAWLRLNLTEIELRAGEWDAAERLLDEWEVSDDGQFLITPPTSAAARCSPPGAATPTRRIDWAQPALERGRARATTRWQLLEVPPRARRRRPARGRPATAADHLRLVHAHCEREGIDEPGAFPVAADLLEALAELGADDEARGVRGRLAGQPRTIRGRRPRWPARDGEAEAAATAYEQLGLRFDAARTRLAHGRAARRRAPMAGRSRRAGSRGAAFDALGSPGWAELARAELARVGGRKPRTDANELTQTERQVAELAAAGQTNKEIAHALFVTTHTVEAHLSKAYAKLGVRSRTELADAALKIGDPGISPGGRAPVRSPACPPQHSLP